MLSVGGCTALRLWVTPHTVMATTYWPHTEKPRFLRINYGKNRSFFGKTASLYQKTTASGKINCKFAADKLAFA
jgi:hypothetical protein